MELGFATKSYESLVEISNNQLQQIINIDETCLTLDWGQLNAVDATYLCMLKNLPELGKAFSKSI